MNNTYCTVVQSARASRTARVRSGFLAVAVTLSMFVALSGCRRKDVVGERLRQRDEEAATEKARAIASISALVERPVIEGNDEPVGPAVDLQTEIDAFTDLPACLKRHRLTDPLVADGIEAIGYQRFLTDACRAIEALKTHDVTKCESAISTPMRLHCENDFAIFAGDESHCPTAARVRDVPEHDITCLAAARRDVRPCAALSGMDRSTCEGLVAHDPSRCGTDAHCLRLLTRWKTALPHTLGKTPYESHATITLKLPDETADGGTRDEMHELTKEASSGALLFIQGKTTRLAFGDTRGYWVRTDDVEAGFVIDLPNLDPGDLKLLHGSVRAAVRYPNTLVQEMVPLAQSEVHITEISREPNGPVKLTVKTTVGLSGSPRDVVFTVTTWLRDRVVEPETKTQHPLFRYYHR